ncbi:HlyD family efflux transporter periplasmic adaptor subunit [Patescibacteria group bacterium]|nr:HlyD family efflux transporter periplasmic adaptor subunit [Patescibacteria group bacterium]
MQIVDKLDKWYGKKVVRGVAVLVAVLAAYLLFFTGNSTVEDTEVAAKLPTVTVESAANTSGDSTFTAVGTLQAVSEAKLQTETGGRIVGVYTELGATVRAGTIIAKLEGASESAQLLQAQGAYEAALAGAAQGNSGVRDAQTNLESAKNQVVTTYKSLNSSVSGVLRSTIDQYFSNPNTTIPGVKIGGTDVSLMNNTRVRLQKSLATWQQGTLTITTQSDLPGALNEAETVIKDVLVITDQILGALNRNNDSNVISEEEKRAQIAVFSGVRSGLVANLSQIDNARTGLTSAEEAFNRAQIAGTGSQVSSADAQIKIALGSLRSAQANYEKTLVRSPITGVVNALYLKAGEYAGPSTPAAIIANNNQGLEVSTSVSQEESVLIKVGDEVKIDKVATGTIAAIGGSIDPTTGKVAVKISVDENESLQNGSAVSVVFTTEKSSDTSEISIPLSAVKMTGSGPIVFTVDADKNTLIANPIVLGNIRGNVVVVTSGINRDTPIVTDGRGLKEGTEVTIETK